MTRQTKATKGQGYTLNAKEANLKHEICNCLGFFSISYLSYRRFFYVNNIMYNVADYT